MVKPRLFFSLILILLFPVLSVTAQSADQLYAGGRQAFTDGLWQTATSQFSRLLREYPEDLRADSAAYMGAVANYNDGKYRDCIKILVSFPGRYPDSAWNQRVAYWEGLARY
ncbi:MAG: outer membrane protein assembly factor BamD, partial [Spirochaetaceae bacterium]|nr:outer membrane protein assembly factor BamD [Spirochaetaceae bacterium]